MNLGIDLAKDVYPITTFRANINSLVKQIKTTHRPLALTQHGKVELMIMDINEYQRLVYDKELRADVLEAQEQAKQGKVCTTAELKAKLKARYARD